MVFIGIILQTIPHKPYTNTKKPIFLILFLLSILFYSCSKNDSPDIVIGKWRAIQQFESNQEIELELCLSYVFTEFSENNTLFGGRIETPDFPDQCLTLSFALLALENLGNSNYRIGSGPFDGNIFTITKEGENLVIIESNGTTKTVYEPI